MEKRLVLAVAVSSLILLFWSFLAPKAPHKPTAPVTAGQEVAELPTKPVAPLPEKITVIPDTTVPISLNKLSLSFVEPWAAINATTFKDYQGLSYVLKNSFLFGSREEVYRRVNVQSENVQSEKISFVYQDKSKEIKKDFLLSGSNYALELNLEIKNLSNLELNLDNIPLILGILDFSGDQNLARLQEVTVETKEKTVRLNAQKETTQEEVKFISLRDKYFCLIVQPEGDYSAVIHKLSKQESQVSLLAKNLRVPPGQKVEQKFRIYLGPQDLQMISAVNPEWNKIIHYGTFDFISQLLLQVLEFFYRLVHNWGVAIILLSLTIYLVLFPFTLKQMRSMKEMQALQPRVEALRKTLKDNPQKLNKEIMQLYREHKVNPLGGCLPLILQMPVFFALYQAMIRSIAFKGASFLWIKDLAEPDRLFKMPFSLPLLGNEFNLLPLLMTGLMFFQQKFSMVSGADSAAKEQQKIMLIVMPLMFGVIFYHMPAGLVLYWFVNSLLMLIYQLRISKVK